MCFLLLRVGRRGRCDYTEGFPDATFVLGNEAPFSGPEAPWHGSACVRTARLSHRQSRRLHPNSLQGPRLVLACALAGHGVGCLSLTHTKDLSDHLVLVVNWCLDLGSSSCFTYCYRQKSQVSHGEACSRLKGGGVGIGVPRGGLSPSPCLAVQAAAQNLLAQLAS